MKKNYAILPMVNMSISQGRYGKFSHQTLNAYDLNGEDGTIERFRSPCQLKLVKKLSKKTTGFANTLIYQSVDKVDFANGRCEFITIALTHCDNIERFKVGTIFDTWEVIYYEGNTGKSTGNHVHLEIGLGKQTNKYKDENGNWCLKNLLNIEDVFYWDKTKTVFCNRGDQGYKFKELPKEANTSIQKRKEVVLLNCDLYVSSVADRKSNVISGKYYVYDNKIINGRVRITNEENSTNVTGWIDIKNIK